MKFITPAIALVALAVAMPAHANTDHCPSLPEGMECFAEAGDGPAMYMVGRNAYDQARLDGDFSVARKWAYKAMEAKFFPAAKMLFKMVHMQIGDGNHGNKVESHRWLLQAIDDGHDYLKPYRRRLEAKMTDDEINEALTKN